MNKWKKFGFVSIEVVITAALVMLAGLAGVTSLGIQGKSNMDKSLAKLDGLNLFGESVPVVGEYDENGYASILGIELTDVNPVSDFSFLYSSQNGGQYTISWYLNNVDKSVVVPKYHTDGKPIVSIGQGAFKGKALTSVALPQGITSINSLAFAENNLTSIIFPDTVSVVGGGAFNENQFPAETALMLSADGKDVIYYAGMQNQNITVPSSVTRLRDNAFEGVTFNSLTLPGSVTSIGTTAFKNAEVKAGLVLGFNVSTMGDSIFEGFKAPFVEVPGVTYGMFYNADIGTLTFQVYSNTIPDLAFAGYKGLSLTLPEDLQSIGNNAFSGSALTSLTIPANVTTLGDSAFSDMSNLTSVTFEGLPSVVGFDVFGASTPLSANSVKVPAGTLTDFQALAGQFGVDAGVFYE